MELLAILGTLVLIIFLAAAIETAVEAVLGTPMNQLGKKYPWLLDWKWALMYVAIAVGIYCVFVYQLDLVFLLARYLEKIAQEINPATTIVLAISITPLGLVLTGVFLGLGSARLHDLISQFFKKKIFDTVNV